MAQFASFPHGPYTVTLDPGAGALALGLTEGPIRLTTQNYGQPIKCDQFGNSTIDGIYLGQDVFVALTLKEWTTNAKAAIFQLASQGTVGLVGRAYGAIGKQMVITAVASTPAATHGPATITLPLVAIAPGFNTEILHGNVERNVPLVFQAFPSSSGSPLTLTHYTVT